jgi:hypothetical protein
MWSPFPSVTSPGFFGGVDGGIDGPEAELAADLGSVGDACPGIVECPARRFFGDRLAVEVEQFQGGDGRIVGHVENLAVDPVRLDGSEQGLADAGVVD